MLSPPASPATQQTHVASLSCEALPRMLTCVIHCCATLTLLRNFPPNLPSSLMYLVLNKLSQQSRPLLHLPAVHQHNTRCFRSCAPFACAASRTPPRASQDMRSDKSQLLASLLRSTTSTGHSCRPVAEAAALQCAHMFDWWTEVGVPTQSGCS